MNLAAFAAFDFAKTDEKLTPRTGRAIFRGRGKP
jgi:hypothetical protein